MYLKDEDIFKYELTRRMFSLPKSFHRIRAANLAKPYAPNFLYSLLSLIEGSAKCNLENNRFVTFHQNLPSILAIKQSCSLALLLYTDLFCKFYKRKLIGEKQCYPTKHFIEKTDEDPVNC
jgi:hypothetical protein